jgi:hypothetical protein
MLTNESRKTSEAYRGCGNLHWDIHLFLLELDLDHGSLERILLLDLSVLFCLFRTSKQTAPLILGSSLALEEPVPKIDFRGHLGRRRPVDLSPAIRSEKDSLQGGRNSSLTGAVVVVLGVQVHSQ